MKCLIDSIRFTGPVFAAFLFLASNPTAQASSHPQAKKLVGTVRVPYADLDLTQQSHVQILLDRIEKAAYRACGGNPRRHPGYGLVPRRTEAVYKECREEAVARAVGEIDAPVLAQARVQAAAR